MNRWRFFVTDTSNATREVFPIGIFQSKFVWQRERGQAFFRKHFNDSLTFNDDSGDFTYFLSYENSGSQCETLTLSIREVCQTGVVERWRGRFTTGKGKFDLDNCLFEIQAETYDEFGCILELLEESVDIIQTPISRVIAKSVQGDIHDLVVVERVIDCDGDPPITVTTCKVDGVTVLCGSITLSEWCVVSVSFSITACPGGSIEQTITTYQREEITTACSGGVCVAPDDTWTLLTDDCSGSGNCVFYRCNYAEVTYDRALLLNDVIDSLVSGGGCGLTYSSIFFNSSPDTGDPFYALTSGGTLNYVTGQSTWTAELLLSQKSDIIDPLSSNPATHAEITLGGVLRWLEYMFNTRWTIVNGVLKVEHVSYFEAATNTGLNLMSGEALRAQSGKNKYEHISEEIPRYVWFMMMESEPDGVGDFKDSTISYDKYCATAQDEERVCDGLTTNLEYIIDYPDDISQDGFVMIATKSDAGIYYINVEQGLASAQYHMNAHLSWANLLANYHRHAAYLPSGFINGSSTSFDSYEPNIRQSPIEIVYCCSDAFVPEEKYTTVLGNKILSSAYVESAEQRLYTGTLKITFKYNR